MSSTSRRAIRHQETLDEIVAHAVDIMREQGAGGLSLAEVARRLGVKTPSLYTYVDSKNALYDELFRRGWEACSSHLAGARDALGPVADGGDVVARATALMRAFVQWSLENAELAQLMLARPVPLWRPSDEAFAPSVAMFSLLAAEIAAYRSRGLLDATADPDALVQNLASAATGVIIRQVANEPGVGLDDGVASRHLAALVAALITPHLPGRN